MITTSQGAQLQPGSSRLGPRVGAAAPEWSGAAAGAITGSALLRVCAAAVRASCARPACLARRCTPCRCGYQHRRHARAARTLTTAAAPAPPRYTGFLPGSQHQMAKTYGRASQACLDERQVTGEPLKWRKFVSYAEFTPAHTPSEGHHIPGYSGHVPGVYAENLYSQTYGKTTLKAVEGDFPKGCEQSAEEQYKTNTQIQFSDDYSHPGRPKDIVHGGVSWAGASPYNVEEPFDLESVNPYPPSVVQIAGGKEPTQTSILLKNFPPAGETKEPALRIAAKKDAHVLTDPAKKTMTVTEGHFKIPGYSGFVSGVDSENIFASTYARTTAAADKMRDRKKESETHLHVDAINEKGILPLNPETPLRPTSSDMPTTATDGPQPHTKHVPGYTGFVPGVQSESLYGKTYGHASHIAMSGCHDRFMWKEQTASQRFSASCS